MKLLISFLIGSYIMVEAFNQLCLMDNGDKPYRLMKYFLAALGGFVLMYHSAQIAFFYIVDKQPTVGVSWLEILLASSLAFFVWPKMEARIREFLFKLHTKKAHR